MDKLTHYADIMKQVITEYATTWVEIDFSSLKSIKNG